MVQPTAIGSKVVATLLLLAFGLAMSAVGIFGGLAKLHEQARNWTAARSYVPVPARVESAYLDSLRGRKGGTTYRAMAEFSYEFQGRRYASKRVSFSDFADNIGDFQHRVHSELRAALERGENVTLWVDPLDPASAVYDKSVRPGMMAIHLLFAIVFPSVGFGALYLIFHLLRGVSPKSDVPPLVRTRGNGYGFMLFATLHVNSVGWTVAQPALKQLVSGQHAPALAPLLLPLAGMAMLYFTWRRWKRPRLTGQPVLQVSSLKPLRGRILFHPRTGLPSPSGQPLVPVAIDAAQLRERRIGRKLEYETIWQQRVLERTVPRGVEMLEFEANAPHLGDKRWRITLHVDARAIIFDLPNAT
ncbi:DUF3592 domain-containing protein [Pseudoduganella sp.]|uniref:DUF3592 domain-containing protein n=1 Tax=Pseudoduganella sp. TaxID=1880898 RepID=UPI0035B470C0